MDEPLRLLPHLPRLKNLRNLVGEDKLSIIK